MSSPAEVPLDIPTTRERIVEQARELYLDAGMAGFSMRKLAARVGVTATALYRHFADKEAVLIAVLDAGFERFTAYLVRGLTGETAGARLELIGEQYARFALENQAYYRIMFMCSRHDVGFAELPRQSAEKHQLSFQLLVDRVRECQEAGILRPGDASELALLIWSFSHGLVSLYLTGNLRRHLEEDEAFIRLLRSARRELVSGLAG
jgi:AcrR family transcriptional regulator